MTLKRTIVAAIAVAGALAAPATAAAIPAGTTALIDRPSGFGALPFDGTNLSQTGPHSISADGRYVVFFSAADALLDGDDNSSFNVYRLDRQRGVVEQVNTTAEGVPQGPNESFLASISANGRYVAFTSFGDPLFPGAPLSGVYVKDMMTGKVELASRANGMNGAPASNGFFTEGTISGDGRHVAFFALGPVDADNVDGKADQVDAYVRDLDAGTTHLVSVKADGTAGGGIDGDHPPVPDFDGHNVAFISENQLDPGDKDTGDDAYLRTNIGKAGEETCFVSFTTNQAPGADVATEVDLGGDGTDVAWSDGHGVFFAQEAANAVGTARRVDVAQTGGSTNDDADLPAFEPVSAAGDQPKRLYFRTDSELSPSDDNGDDDVYDAEVAFIGDPNHLHLDTSGERHGSMGDVAGAKQGAIVVYDAESTDLPGSDPDFGQVYQHVNGVDRNISQPPGRAPRVDDANSSFIDTNRSVSDDGGKVVFETAAPALGGSNDDDQIALRNVVSGGTSLLSAEPDGTPGNNGASEPTIDAAGDKVAFVSSSSDLLVTGNPNGGTHVYVRDLTTGELALVDRRTDGKPIDGGVGHAVIAPDGRHLVYTSSAKDAPGAPPNNNILHAYVVDLQSGNTTLVDRTPSGTIGNGPVRAVDISGDGSVTAFTSEATNLGAAGSSSHQQLYVANPGAHTLEWASVPEDGDPTHVDAGGPSLSRSGTRVAFDQDAPGFGHGMTGDSQVFVRDLEQGSTALVSGLPGGVDGSSHTPSLSADGKRVAFSTFVGDDLEKTEEFAPGLGAQAASADAAAAPVSGVYLRDLDEQEPTLVSVPLDPSRTAEPGFGTGVSLDGTGSCVAFESTAGAPLSDPSYGPDFTHVYLRAVDDDCPGTAAHPEPPPERPPGGGGPAPGTGDKPHDNGGLPPVDKTAPAISSAKLTPPTFAVGRSATVRSARAAVGTTFSFSLSEPAATSIAISQRTTGRKKGTRCVAPQRGLTKRCTRIVDVVTLKRATTVKGVNRVAFTGKIGRTTLKPGRYQAVLTARDKAGNVSKPVKLMFTVVKR